MIALGCDHGGYELMQEVKAYLDKQGLEYQDFGCYSNEAVDYPVYARKSSTMRSRTERVIRES